MRRVNAFLLSSVFPLTDGDSELGPRFTSLYAFVPRVLNFCVGITSAVVKPGTTAATTTHFPRFRDGAAFGTCGTDCRRRVCSCEYVDITKKKKRM